MSIERSEWLLLVAEQLKNPNLSEAEKTAIIRKEIGNQIAWLRRHLRGMIHGREEAFAQKRRFKQLLVSCQGDNFAGKRVMRGIAAIDASIELYDGFLDSCGQQVLINLEMYERYGASIHDLAQVVGCNIRNVEKAYAKVINRSELKREDRNDRIFIDLIFVANIELPVMKRKPDTLFGYEWFMPLKEAITEHFVAAMKRNPEFRKGTDEVLYKCFPELRAHMFTIKPNGTAEKYYPPLMLM